MSNPGDDASDFRELCSFMGLTLATWQQLEDTLFLLFVKMLGAPKREVCSVVYHGIQSFDQRRVMIDRIALYFFEESAHSSAWDEINSSLMAAAPNRNKVAHYCVEYEMTSFGKTLAETAFGAPHLIPSRYNVVDFLKGRTPDKKGHKLSTTELSSYIREFDGIRAKINKLIDAVSLPPPQQGLGLLQAASRGTGMLGGGLLGTTPATDPPRAK